jgi:hypothetical protein
MIEGVEQCPNLFRFVRSHATLLDCGMLVFWLTTFVLIAICMFDRSHGDVIGRAVALLASYFAPETLHMVSAFFE